MWDYESRQWTVDGKYPAYMCYVAKIKGTGPTAGSHFEIDFSINASPLDIQRMFMWSWSLSSHDAMGEHGE